MKKILVIEDEEPVRMNIAELLDLEGFAVLEAENGRIGLKIAQTEIPDLIISDANMPELDGYGVLSALRQNPKTAAIPFVFLTARADTTDMRQGMRLGADDYLTKPFTLDELLHTITTRLDRQDSIQQTLNTKLHDLRANISMALPHELRTPLIGILGFSKVIKTEYDSLEPAEMGEMADYIYTSAEQLHRIIENYLLYVQLETLSTDADKVNLLRQSITPDTYDIIMTAVLTKAAAVHRKNDIQSQCEDCPLAIAPEHFTKILHELADNAIKFSNTDTPVTVASSSDDTFYYLSISNQGRGMTNDEIENLGAFMQFDRASQEQQGAGMGLVIVKRIVALYGGKFSIESTVNELTTVTIALPIAHL
jgi:two-component system sensor histidine kinase/response regulator